MFESRKIKKSRTMGSICY